MKTEEYVVELEKDEDGVWVATWYAKGGGGVVTDGPTIERALVRFRAALALHLDDEAIAKRAVLTPRLIGLSKPVLAKLEAARLAKEEADNAREKASGVMKKAVAELSQRGLSVRDVGTLLGVSRQRAHQLLISRTGERHALRSWRGSVKFDLDLKATRR